MNEPRKRNVLLICLDQWRADCVSAVGHPNVKTPNLDKLAAEGMLFRNHYGQCTPCGPARTSLLTGTYLMNHRSGRNGTPLDARHTNIALEARKAGYDPVLFGYTDTSLDPRQRHPNDPALKAYDEGVMPGFSVPLHLPEDFGAWVADLLSKGYDLPGGREDLFKANAAFTKPLGRGFRYIPTNYKAEDSETAFITNAFLKWLLSRKGMPWFAHLVYFRPHPPLIACEPYNAMVSPDDVDMPIRALTYEQEAAQHPFLAYELEKLREPGKYDENSQLDLLKAGDLEIRQMKAAYFGLIAEVDFHIGRIFERLKSAGEYENTLLIVTSDHAEMLGDHFMWGKEIYFDQAFHLPLIVRDPRPLANLTRSKQSTEFTEAIDLMPTILDWLKQPIPRACDGISLLPIIEGSNLTNWRSEVFFEHDFRNVQTQKAETILGLESDECSYALIRDRDYKYVHFASLPPLLFNLKTDPFERRNLAGEEEYRGVLLHYAQKMLKWRLIKNERSLTNMELTKDGVISRN